MRKIDLLIKLQNIEGNPEVMFEVELEENGVSIFRKIDFVDEVKLMGDDEVVIGLFPEEDVKDWWEDN